MYHVSTKRVNECMINVHCYYWPLPQMSGCIVHSLINVEYVHVGTKTMTTSISVL